MKDSLAFVAATFGAGSSETVQLLHDASPVNPDQALIAGGITVFVGLISMLLSRLLNNWFKTKQS